MALAYADLGMGGHQHCCGEWSAAIVLYRRAAQRFKDAGNVRGWGWAAVQLEWMLFLQGRFAESLEWIGEIIRTGRDAADSQVLGWGLQDLGMITALVEGAYDRGNEHLERAIDLFEAIPDYQSVVSALGYLGQSYLHAGALDRALGVLDRAKGVIRQHRVRGPNATPALYAMAAASLEVAERAAPSERVRVLREARRACSALRGDGRIAPFGSVTGARLQGTLEWLNARPGAARKWWRRSIALAETLTARYGARAESFGKGPAAGGW